SSPRPLPSPRRPVRPRPARGTVTRESEPPRGSRHRGRTDSRAGSHAPSGCDPLRSGWCHTASVQALSHGAVSVGGPYAYRRKSTRSARQNGQLCVPVPVQYRWETPLAERAWSKARFIGASSASFSPLNGSGPRQPTLFVVPMPTVMVLFGNWLAQPPAYSPSLVV